MGGFFASPVGVGHLVESAFTSLRPDVRRLSCVGPCLLEVGSSGKLMHSLRRSTHTQMPGLFGGRIGGEARLPAGLRGRQRRWSSTAKAARRGGLSPPAFAPGCPTSMLVPNFQGRSARRATAASLHPSKPAPTIKSFPPKKPHTPLEGPSSLHHRPQNRLESPTSRHHPHPASKNEALSTRCPTPRPGNEADLGQSGEGIGVRTRRQAQTNWRFVEHWQRSHGADEPAEWPRDGLLPGRKAKQRPHPSQIPKGSAATEPQGSKRSAATEPKAQRSKRTESKRSAANLELAPRVQLDMCVKALNGQVGTSNRHTNVVFIDIEGLALGLHC